MVIVYFVIRAMEFKSKAEQNRQALTLNIIEVEVGSFALFVFNWFIAKYFYLRNKEDVLKVMIIIVAFSVPIMIFCIQLLNEMINLNDDLPEAE